MVPITPSYLVRDLARELGLPVVIAARTGLGTINHTLLTVEAARAAGLRVAAVVMTPWPADPEPIEVSNRATVKLFGDVSVSGLPALSPERLGAAGPALALAGLDRRGRNLGRCGWVICCGGEASQGRDIRTGDLRLDGDAVRRLRARASARRRVGRRRLCRSRPPRELTTSTQGHSVWPPGTRCGYVGADGTAVERFVDAGRWEPLRWPVLVLLAAAPVTLAAGLAASIRELHARASAPPRRRVGGITT